MSRRRLPQQAIMDGKHVVQVLQNQHKNYFDVLVVRAGGKERRVLVHRSRLSFLPARRSPVTVRREGKPDAAVVQQPLW